MFEIRPPPLFEISATDLGYVLRFDSDQSGEWCTETYRCIEDMFERIRGLCGIYLQSCPECDLPRERWCEACKAEAAREG